MSKQVPIFLLTSSRADFGIYLPLAKKLKDHPYFELCIIAFGTHLSPMHGYTVDDIRKHGFTPFAELETYPEDDSPDGITKAMAKTMKAFAKVFRKIKALNPVVLSMGDRYEMFAAVAASVPFGFTIAHIHGGETTLGAMDDAFRHSITAMARMHFAATETYAERIRQMKGNSDHIIVSGAPSLDNLNGFKPYSKEEIKAKFGFTPDTPLLVTFHPETVNYEKNGLYIRELCEALTRLPGQLVVTMPNADTAGNEVRQVMMDFVKSQGDRAIAIESFGTEGYFSMMHHCRMLIGNSSSGIIEAASFGKHVIDVGDRQKGRYAGDNVHHVPCTADAIADEVLRLWDAGPYTEKNPYGDGHAADKIIKELENYIGVRYAY